MHGVYEPQLTDRGLRLVEAWREGDIAAFSYALIAEASQDGS
jgi:hypothetical protein